MENIISNAMKCTKDIDAKLRNSEYNIKSFKGVKNVSVSDLETARMYAEQIANTGNYYGLMDPCGNVKAILEKYNCLLESSIF